jgi:hypothetical protein
VYGIHVVLAVRTFVSSAIVIAVVTPRRYTARRLICLTISQRFLPPCSGLNPTHDVVSTLLLDVKPPESRGVGIRFGAAASENDNTAEAATGSDRGFCDRRDERAQMDRALLHFDVAA